MEMTGAEILIEGLRREGVEHIFGYAGATICAAVDVLRQHPEIGYTLVRTEQNAGHMASGYARISGKAGVCLVTSGPGATNLITGVATAYMDSIPMVAITGQVPSNLLGRDIFQEVDITGAVSPFTKHNYLVKDAADLPRVIKEAFYIASTGRPGPVLIDIPSDIQEQRVADVAFPDSVNIRGYKPSVRGNDLQIRRVADTIARAKQPLICAGGGVWLAGARDELAALAERLQIPVVKTMMGLSVLPTDHPLNMGMIGAHGNRCANKALAKSDLLIMVGTRAADRAIIEPKEIQRRMATIHIDVDPAEIGKNMEAAVPLVGDVKAILNQLLALDIQAPDAAQWRQFLKSFRQAELTRVFPRREGSVFPGTLLRQLGLQLLIGHSQQGGKDLLGPGVQGAAVGAELVQTVRQLIHAVRQLSAAVQQRAESVIQLGGTVHQLIHGIRELAQGIGQAPQIAGGKVVGIYLIEEAVGDDGEGGLQREVRYVGADLHIVGQVQLLLADAQILLQAGEGHAHDGDAVAVVDELTVGDGDIGEVGSIQQGAGEGHEGDIHLLADAVDGTHLILVVFILEADGHLAALARQLAGGDGLAIQSVVDTHAHRQLLLEGAGPAVVLHLLGVVQALDGLLSLGGQGVLDPVADQDLLGAAVGSGHDVHRLILDGLRVGGGGGRRHGGRGLGIIGVLAHGVGGDAGGAYGHRHG